MPPASFDDYAQFYDADFSHTEIGRLQRKEVRRRLISKLHNTDQVLEINCGTGVDAFELAPYVKNYLATDVSEKMIEWCRKKMESKPLDHLQFKSIGIQDLDQEMNKHNFLFSDFGGLNCLDPEEFQNFAERCMIKMPSQSELFLVIMGRACLWEQFYFCLKARFRKAFRRLNRKGIDTNIGSSNFKTWYYTPREVKKFFAPDFKSISQGPVAFFVPPSYLQPYFTRHPKALRLLEKADQVFCNFRWLANFGDHYYLYLKKRT